jgi:hypothetical protein
MLCGRSLFTGTGALFCAVLIFTNLAAGADEAWRSALLTDGSAGTPGIAAAGGDRGRDTVILAASGDRRQTRRPAAVQPAVLYEEPLDIATAAAGVMALAGLVTWSFVEDGDWGPEVVADLEVPEHRMKVRLSIRRNPDASLPASHIVEAMIDTPADFPGKSIRGVPRLVLKASEAERGQPLIGAAAKVADGFFWIALSAINADVTQNLQLLRERPWFDLPMVYENGQRAIMTFEKGTPGEQAFDRALAAWGKD